MTITVITPNARYLRSVITELSPVLLSDSESHVEVSITKAEGEPDET